MQLGLQVTPYFLGARPGTRGAASRRSPGQRTRPAWIPCGCTTTSLVRPLPAAFGPPLGVELLYLGLLVWGQVCVGGGDVGL
jgi:hypothetical protein